MSLREKRARLDDGSHPHHHHHDLRELTEEADAFALDEASDESTKNPELEGLIRNMITVLGEDVTREGLARTPQRVARAYETLTSGYQMSVDQIVNNAIFTEQYDEIVSVKNIHFFSLCEHHLLPFFGIANIGYIPDGKVIGLSKIPRIVDMYARRLQLQERLTTQVANCLKEVLEPRGVAVVVEAYHLCMMMRGVEKQDSLTVTSCMLGDFRTSPQTRNEFMTLCGGHSLKRS
jgi:GTP cyclohydrolase IA